MGNSFTKDIYESLKLDPEKVASLSLEDVNDKIFVYMLNDKGNYSKLHKQIQIFGNMPLEKMIITAVHGNVSLMPLFGVTSDADKRLYIMRRLSEQGPLDLIYYNAFPIVVSKVIMEFICMYNDTYGFRERLLTKFQFSNFTHKAVLSICRQIRFDKSAIGRPEDIFVTFLGPQIKSMYRYVKKTNNFSSAMTFQYLKGFYDSSLRHVTSIDNQHIPFMKANYDIVPEIPEEDVREIALLLSDRIMTRENMASYLRVPLEWIPEIQSQREKISSRGSSPALIDDLLE